MSSLSETLNGSPQKQVVIVGGGFAGLHCAEALASESNLHITLLDKNNYQQFQPLLYQVATASLSPSDAAFNLRAVLTRHKNIDVKMTEVVSVDLPSCTVRGKDGDVYRGDYLVLAAGAQANFFGVPGVEKFAYPMYSLLDAERLRSRVLEVFEAAEVAGAQGEKTIPSIAVIGGGATGVEMAGAMADICQRAPDTLYKNFHLRDVVVTLINGKDEVLSGFTEKSKTYAKSVLEERGVKLRLGVQVQELTDREVLLSDQTRIPCDLAIWAGGLKAASLSESTGLKPGHGGRMDVQADLSIVGFPGVYALGDFANTADKDGKPLPQLASVAQQAGHHCARNIAASAKGEKTADFAYFDKGIMAMIGRNAAVAEVGEGHHSLTGPIAFAAWLGVHAVLLTTLRAKMGAFFDWAWNYFGGMRVEAILDTPSHSRFAEHPADAALDEARS